jgi:hypothetical protein
MRSRKYWRNDKFSIFEIEKEGPWYKTCLGIFRVMEKEGDRGRVILYGTLPFITGGEDKGEDNGVVKLGRGETYEVVELDYGRSPDDYRSGQVVVRLSDCQIRRSWVSRMVALRRDELDSVMGYVEVECDIEWNEPLEIWEPGVRLVGQVIND